MKKRKARVRTWNYTKRRINGKLCKVKVHRKRDGKELVRKVGVRNTTDSRY
jgi:hypothetical protein